MIQYELEPSFALLPQQQPDRSFSLSIIVLNGLFRLSTRCIVLVPLVLIYSTQINRCQSVYRTVYAVDDWGIGVRLPTRAAVVTLRKTVRTRVGHTQPAIQRLPAALFLQTKQSRLEFVH